MRTYTGETVGLDDGEASTFYISTFSYKHILWQASHILYAWKEL